MVHGLLDLSNVRLGYIDVWPGASLVETTEKEDSTSVKTRLRRRAKALTRRVRMMLTGDKDEEKRDTRAVGPSVTFFFIRVSRQHHPNSPRQRLSSSPRSCFSDVLSSFSYVCHTILIE